MLPNAIFSGLKPGIGAQLNHSHPLNRDLRAWWLLNERGGLQIYDMVNQLVGDLTNMTALKWVDREKGAALTFDDGDDRIEITGDPAPLKITGTKITMAATIYPISIGGIPRIIDKQTPYSFSGYAMRCDGEVGNALSATINGSNYQTSANTLNTGVVQRVCVTYDGANVRFYRDGRQIGSSANTESMVEETQPVQIGNRADGGRGFDGYIYDVQIWARGLSSEEVLDDFLNPYGSSVYPRLFYGIKKATASGGSSGVGNISGTSAGVATVSGLVKGTGKIAGTSAGVASVSGTTKGTGKISGSSAGVASVTGTVKGIVKVSGSSAGVATVSGLVKGQGKIFGTSSGVATVTGTVKGAGKVVAASQGTTTVTGIVKGIGKISGVAAGSSTVSGTLTQPTGSLSGTAAGTSTVSGTVKGSGRVAGSASGASTCSGIIHGVARVQATTSGTSTATGTVKGVGRISGLSIGFALAIGLLKGAGKISGISTGSSTVSGTLIQPYGSNPRIVSFSGPYKKTKSADLAYIKTVTFTGPYQNE